MKKTDDERMSELFRQITEIPFTEDLEQRILSQASKTKIQKRKKKFTQYIGKVSTLAAGLMVAAVFVVVVLNGPTKSQNTTDASMTSSAASMPAKIQTEYHLAKSPLRISNLHIGQEKGYPIESEVEASVSNDSNQTIYAQDVFGVLAFSKTQAISSLNQADWFSFVNGLDKKHPIGPHQTQQWIFHPVGAPNHHLALSEIPHLEFYSSQLTNSSSESAVWKVNAITVVNANATSNSVVHADKTDGESVVVSADLVNTTSNPIQLKHSFAFIWFDENHTASFTTYGTMRFINPISVNGNSVVKSGERIHVSFHVIGSAGVAYNQNSVHILIVNIP